MEKTVKMSIIKWNYLCIYYSTLPPFNVAQSVRETVLIRNNLSVLSVNVRGLNSHEKRNKLFTWLEENKIEITLLQETHLIEKSKVMYIRNWGGKTIHSFSDSSFSRAVSILF